MNFSQLHEQVRLEMLRRIQRGDLTSAMLARQTQLVPAHISNFLNRKRMLSLAALDKVLSAQRLTVEELVDTAPIDWRHLRSESYQSIPLVAHSTAIFQAVIPSNLVLRVLKVESGLLRTLRVQCPAVRRQWERFVAVRITAQQSQSMRPVLPRTAIILIDRHYSSPDEYSDQERTIHAVKIANMIRFRYVELARGQLVLRPRNLSYPIELLELKSPQAASDYLIGRVFRILAD